MVNIMYVQLVQHQDLVDRDVDLVLALDLLRGGSGGGDGVVTGPV